MTKKQKRLLILGGGPEQVTAVRIAKEFGAHVIVFDGGSNPPAAAIADETYIVNIKDRDQLLTKAAEIKPDAVFVHAAELAIEAGAIQSALNIHGMDLDLAIKGTDKATRSQVLTRQNIRMPSFRFLPDGSSLDAWQSALLAIGLPAVIKPTRLAGAKGVNFIEKPSDLAAYFKEKEKLGQQDFILEERVNGLQISTESLFLGGQLIHTNIALRHYDTTADLAPFAIEDGHSMPYENDATDRMAIEEIMQKAASALDLANGVLKGDLIKTANGSFVTLEMAVRTSGGRFADTVAPIATGVNILYPLIADCLTIDCPKELYQRPETQGVSQRFLFLPTGTPLSGQVPVEFLKSEPGVIDIVMRPDFADLKTVPALYSHHDRLGYCICTGKTAVAADQAARGLIAKMARFATKRIT